MSHWAMDQQHQQCIVIG